MSVLLHFLRWKFGLSAAQTQTTDSERATLARYATGRKCLVEIGVWHGVTTSLLREVMNPDGLIYAVDPYPVGRLGISLQRLIAYNEVARIGNGEVRWVRETGSSAAKTLSPILASQVDFIFIDGDHSFEGLKADWEGWSPLVIHGGIVALHDSRSTPTRPIQEAGSVRYTNAAIRCDPFFTTVAEVDSLTVFQRNEI